MYFIGLFQHLQDLELTGDSPSSREKSPGDPTFIPAFVPPLRGRLKLVDFSAVYFLKDMIGQIGGIRFRYMFLYDVYGMRPLLAACGETLESVLLNPTDCLGEQLSLRGRKFHLTISQLSYPFGALIYRGIRRSGHSRSLGLLSIAHRAMVHQTP